MVGSLVVALLVALAQVTDSPGVGVPRGVSSGIMAEQQDVGTFVVDAFEAQGLAALESDEGVRIVVPRAWLPSTAKEGHVLRVSRSESGGRSSLSLQVDEAATETRRGQMRERRDQLPKGPEGDLDL